MIKALKPEAISLARNEYGYLVLLSIFETVDDTVLIAKTLLPEFQKQLQELACDKYGRTPLLYPFSERHPRVVPRPALAVLEEVDKLREYTRYGSLPKAFFIFFLHHLPHYQYGIPAMRTRIIRPHDIYVSRGKGET